MSERELLRRTADLAADYLGLARRRAPSSRRPRRRSWRAALGGPLSGTARASRSRWSSGWRADAEPGVVELGRRALLRLRDRRRACRPRWPRTGSTTTWDQNAGLGVHRARRPRWSRRSAGRLAEGAARAARAAPRSRFTTGCQMAHVTALAAARHARARARGLGRRRARASPASPPITRGRRAPSAHVTRGPRAAAARASARASIATVARRRPGTHAASRALERGAGRARRALRSSALRPAR